MILVGLDLGRTQSRPRRKHRQAPRRARSLAPRTGSIRSATPAPARIPGAAAVPRSVNRTGATPSDASTIPVMMLSPRSDCREMTKSPVPRVACLRPMAAISNTLDRRQKRRATLVHLPSRTRPVRDPHAALRELRLARLRPADGLPTSGRPPRSSCRSRRPARSGTPRRGGKPLQQAARSSPHTAIPRRSRPGFDRPTAHPRGQQQRRGKLRALPDAHRRTCRGGTAAMNQRRQRLARGVDLVAELTQRVEQRFLGPLMHPRHPVQPINAAPQADQGARKPRRGPAFATNSSNGCWASPARHLPAHAIDRQRAIARFDRVRFRLIMKPRWRRHSTITWVSSLHNAPRNTSPRPPGPPNQRAVRNALGPRHPHE
jgi:hypothetical protein